MNPADRLPAAIDAWTTPEPPKRRKRRSRPPPTDPGEPKRHSKAAEVEPEAAETVAERLDRLIAEGRRIEFQSPIRIARRVPRLD